MVIVRHRSKFRADQSNRSGDITVSRIFKMAAIRHTGFLNVRNFICRWGSEGQYAFTLPNFVPMDQNVEEI